MHRLVVQQLSADQAEQIATALEQQAPNLTQAIGQWETSDRIWQLELYLNSEQSSEAEKIIRQIAATLGVLEPDIQSETLPDKDWVTESLKGLTPLSAGRFFVHGGHDRDKRRGGGINLELDAGQAFGTGHHGTTLGCLIALDRILKYQSPQAMLDLGCGTGILAIAAARATSMSVIASDIDPIAIDVTNANARINNVGPLIKAITAIGTQHTVLQENAPYDLIMANILAGPLMKLAPKIAPLLAPNSTLVLSGLLLHQAARIIARYRAQGLTFMHCEKLEGWATLTLVRRTIL